VTVSLQSRVLVEVDFHNLANAPIIARHFTHVPHVASVANYGPPSGLDDWIRLKRPSAQLQFLFSASGKFPVYDTYTFDTLTKTVTPGRRYSSE
jgi:hypothetical protein